MARAEGAVVADLNAAFGRASNDLASLFTDHVHPNDRGYTAVAEEFFRAITQSVGAASSAGQEAAGPPDTAGSSGNRHRPRWVGRRSAWPSARR
jgi:hypothetical protein